MLVRIILSVLMVAFPRASVPLFSCITIAFLLSCKVPSGRWSWFIISSTACSRLRRWASKPFVICWWLINTSILRSSFARLFTILRLRLIKVRMALRSGVWTASNICILGRVLGRSISWFHISSMRFLLLDLRTAQVVARSRGSFSLRKVIISCRCNSCSYRVTSQMFRAVSSLLLLSLLTITCSDSWAASFREMAWSMVRLSQISAVGCVIQIIMSRRLSFFNHWTFPTCSWRFLIRSLNTSSTVFYLISLAWISSASTSNICCRLLNIIYVLFKCISYFCWVLLSAWLLSIMCRVLSSACCCRARRSILGSGWLLLRRVQGASLITLPCLPIARWWSMYILLRPSVSCRWMHAMVAMLGWVTIIVLWRWHGSPARRMSWRTSFYFASGEFFQVSNARL